MIKTDPGHVTEVANRVAEVESFSEAYSITGQYDLLVKLYGEPKGRNIRYAEAFELNQYGSPATVEELKQLFPLF